MATLKRLSKPRCCCFVIGDSEHTESGLLPSGSGPRPCCVWMRGCSAPLSAVLRPSAALRGLSSNGAERSESSDAVLAPSEGAEICGSPRGEPPHRREHKPTPLSGSDRLRPEAAAMARHYGGPITACPASVPLPRRPSSADNSVEVVVDLDQYARIAKVASR
jgi:hypothetical protein